MGISEIGLIHLACNEVHIGSKFALPRKGADVSNGVSLYARRQTGEL
jgi:hypothetical protein